MIPIEDFKRNVFNWADEIKVKPKEIRVRKMTKKWASCTNKGTLTFSFDLLNEHKEFVNFAIVHELLHLRYPNHGKMFKSLLKTYLGKNNVGEYTYKFEDSK